MAQQEMVNISKADYEKMLKRQQALEKGLAKRREKIEVKKQSNLKSSDFVLRQLGKNVISSKNNFDIDRTGWASSVASVNDMVANNDKYKGWTVKEEDFDADENGEGGDGIDEVLVHDPQNNLRFINGYKVKPSKFAARKDYHANFPSATERKKKENSFGNYMRDTVIDEEGNIKYRYPDAVRVGTDGKIKPKDENDEYKQQPKLKDHFARYVTKKFMDLFKIEQYQSYSSIPKNKRSKASIIFTNTAWRAKTKDLLKEVSNMDLNNLPVDEQNKMINKQLKENTLLKNAMVKYIQSMVNYSPTKDDKGVSIPDDFTDYYLGFFIDSVNEAVSQ